MSPGHPQPFPGERAASSLDEDKVEIVEGALAIYASSPGVERGFCAACGSSLTYARANRPGLFDITTATLDDPEAFPPAIEIWLEERLSWEAANPDLPHFAQFSTPALESPPADA